MVPRNGIIVVVALIGMLSLFNIYHGIYANGLLKSNDEKLTQTTKMISRLQRELIALKRTEIANRPPDEGGQ